MSRKPKAESREPYDNRRFPALDSRLSTLDQFFALAFGLFLGLTLWKFGNPVILDTKVITPATLADFWNDAWPPHWAGWFFLPFAAIGAVLILQKYIAGNSADKSTIPVPSPPGGERARVRGGELAEKQVSTTSSLPPHPAPLPRWGRGNRITKWLWLLPLLWFGWQIFSATRTVDVNLTAATIWQFAGCVAAYFLGAFLFTSRRTQIFLLAGILPALIFCLMQAVEQRLFEFPQSHQMLVEGEQNGWTNFPPEAVTEMKSENIIVTTNGVDVANPMILAKYAKSRVFGTLVYPNALAGIILLLLPATLVLAFSSTKKLKPFIRLAVIALAIFLGGAAFVWSGSKLGWLLGIGVIGLFLLRLDWPKRFKFMAVIAILILGLGVFALRFHSYFDKGATSVGARFDYWHAAVQTTMENPLTGSGPGTFQRPYAHLKAPDSEMARLTHNDYLEQFSDSGVIGGLAYAVWVFLALLIIGKNVWSHRDDFYFAIFAGLLAWFAQGLGEFSLYIPALAWIAFTLLGGLIGAKQMNIR